MPCHCWRVTVDAFGERAQSDHLRLRKEHGQMVLAQPAVAGPPLPADRTGVMTARSYMMLCHSRHMVTSEPDRVRVFVSPSSHSGGSALGAG